MSTYKHAQPPQANWVCQVCAFRHFVCNNKLKYAWLYLCCLSQMAYIRKYDIMIWWTIFFDVQIFLMRSVWKWELSVKQMRIGLPHAIANQNADIMSFLTGGKSRRMTNQNDYTLCPSWNTIFISPIYCT